MVNDTILVKIIIPSGTLFTCNARIVTLNGEDGVFGVMANHCALIANLVKGIIDISSKEKNFRFFINGGIAKIMAKEVNIMTEIALETTNFSKKQIEEIM